MSIAVMGAVWPLQLPDSQKIVLLALADCANDEGHAWPSIATLARKCSKCERTVQSVLRDLAKLGHVTRVEVPGKGCRYLLHPRNDCTPAAAAPRKECAPQPLPQTPAAAAPKPSRTIKGKEANASSPQLAVKPDLFPKPDWAEPQTWADWLDVRRAKKARNTATAYAGFLADIARLACPEWPPDRLLAHAVARSWAGIYEPKEGYPSNGRLPGHHSQPVASLRGARPDPALDMVLQAEREEREAQAQHEDSWPDRTARLALPPGEYGRPRLASG